LLFSIIVVVVVVEWVAGDAAGLGAGEHLLRPRYQSQTAGAAENGR